MLTFGIYRDYTIPNRLKVTHSTTKRYTSEALNSKFHFEGRYLKHQRHESRRTLGGGHRLRGRDGHGGGIWP